MKTNSIRLRFACVAVCALLMAIVINCDAVTAQHPSSVTPSPTPRIMRGSVAFTQPLRQTDQATAEPGRVAAVHVRRGSVVQKGDLLAELDTTALLAARKIAEQRSSSTAKKEALEVELRRRLRMHETMRGLTAQGAGTPEELLDTEAEAKIAALNVREAEEVLERAKLELAEIDAKLELRRVRAKYDGVVVEVHREPGEYVSAADAKVATLVDLRQLRASFFLPTESTEDLRTGSRLALEFVRSQKMADCEVEYVGPLTHADSGRVRVDVLIDNSSGKFRSGLQCFLPKYSKTQKVSGRFPEQIFQNGGASKR